MSLSLAGTQSPLKIVYIGGGGGVGHLQDIDPRTGHPKLTIYN